MYTDRNDGNCRSSRTAYIKEYGAAVKRRPGVLGRRGNARRGLERFREVYNSKLGEFSTTRQRRKLRDYAGSEEYVLYYARSRIG